jgi:hypothetical protein
LRTAWTPSGARSARAISYPTGTPPRGRPSTTGACQARSTSRSPSIRPAARRHEKRRSSVWYVITRRLPPTLALGRLTLGYPFPRLAHGSAPSSGGAR